MTTHPRHSGVRESTPEHLWRKVDVFVSLPPYEIKERDKYVLRACKGLYEVSSKPSSRVRRIRALPPRPFRGFRRG